VSVGVDVVLNTQRIKSSSNEQLLNFFRVPFLYEARYCVHKRPPVASVLSKTNARHIFLLFKAIFFFSPGATQPIVGFVFYSLYRALASSRTRLLDHTQRRATFGRTPLNEWSVRRRDLYLTTHNTHNRQTSMPRVGFEPTIPAGERP
jgi:hypothetical protein